MKTSCLYPPSNEMFSDSVIGNFLQSSWTPPNLIFEEFECRREPGHNRIQRPRQAARQSVAATERSCSTGPTKVKPQLVTATPSSYSRLSTGNGRPIGATPKRKFPSRRCSPPDSNVSKEDRKKSRHRERCRLNQELYRERQRKLTQSLEASVQSLQQDILTLNRQSCELSSAPTAQSMWVVATQYFHHYQNFSLAPTSFRDAARAFLQATMASDVVDGTLSGVETLLESWTRFSLFFGRIQLTLADLHSYDSCTLVASTIISLTISENSLSQAFPSLKSSGNGSAEDKKRSQLATKLTGQRIVMRGTVRLSWNGSINRVARLQSQADLLSSILGVLGNLDDVACVFENARVTPDFRLVDL